MGGVKKHIWYDNGNGKTVCTSHVLAHFGIAPETYHYSAFIKQIANVLRRNGYAVRSRNSRIEKAKASTVGAVRKAIRKNNWGDPKGTRYLVYVPGHVLLIDETGKTTVDTWPRKRDRRQVTQICAVFAKDEFARKVQAKDQENARRLNRSVCTSPLVLPKNLAKEGAAFNMRNRLSQIGIVRIEPNDQKD